MSMDMLQATMTAQVVFWVDSMDIGSMCSVYYNVIIWVEYRLARRLEASWDWLF